MPPLTEEEQKDSQARKEEFRAGLIELSEKTQIDVVSYPQFMGQKGGTFSVSVVTDFIDKKHAPIPSIMSDEIIQK